MSTLVITEIIPIEADADGVLRVSKTRVTLDTIVAAFNDGATAEEIAQQYPTVPLADLYSVIGHYLRRNVEVGVYLSRRRQEAEQVRKENEVRFNPIGVRERLITRQVTRNT